MGINQQVIKYHVINKVKAQKTVGGKGSEWWWPLSQISKDETKRVGIPGKNKINKYAPQQEP